MFPLDLGSLLRGLGSAMSFPRGLLLEGFGLTSFEFELPRTGVEPLSMDLGFPMDGLFTSLPLSVAGLPFPLVGILLFPGAIGLGSGFSALVLTDPGVFGLFFKGVWLLLSAGFGV